MSNGHIEIQSIMEDAQVRAPRDTIVHTRKPSADAAYERLCELQCALKRLEDAVNRTSIDNTEAAWHDAYENLTAAFRYAMTVEKSIITNN